MLPTIYLEKTNQGAAIMSDDKLVVELPPYLCVAWAIKLLQFSGSDTRKVSDNIRFIPYGHDA